MKRFDFLVQTMLILLGLILGLTSSVNKEFFGMILLIQLLLGPWQIISALFYIGLKTSFKKGRQWHLIISSFYLIIIYALANYFKRPDPLMIKIALTIIPWSLALLYYYITWRTTFPKQEKSSSFLPHLNF
ncbi:MAG TPA: hypothetical protein VIM65_15790 [Cyclobacteriaceae bacterium]